MDNPVSGFMIRLPIVIPTVPFCIADSIAIVIDCLLFILNQFELLYPMKSMEKINSIIAGPNWERLFTKVCHSLASAPIIIIINNTVEIFVPIFSKLSANCLFFLRTNTPKPTGMAVIKNIVNPNDMRFNGGASAPIKYFIERIVTIGKVIIVNKLITAV